MTHKEQIEDIAKSIKRHRDLEISSEISNEAFGRTFTLYDKEEQQFWLILKASERSEWKDIVGNVIPGYGFTSNKPYKGNKVDGFPIPRDSQLGAILIQNHEGKHSYKHDKGKIEIEIYNRASYTPSSEGEYATDIQIKIAGDSRTHSFQNIAKILELQLEIDRDREKLEQTVDDNAKNELLKSIEKKEEKQREYINKAQSFIRKYAELRFQPILDPIQDAIRRSEVFKGNLIINGGPGTGKTTSLIQRIKFLISPTIEEEIKLNKDQKNILFNQKTSWIFYSPNELLALFLRNSMKMEELIANDESVKVWSSHKSKLMNSYKLVDTQTKNPFMIYNKSQGSLIKNTPNSIKSINKKFWNYYFNFQKEKIEKVIEIDVSPFKWRNLGKSIINYLQERQDVKKIEDFIRLFFNLEEQFKTESDKISEEYTTLIKSVVAKIQVEINKDDKRITVLLEILNGWKDTSQETEVDEEYDTEIEQEDFDEKEEQTAFDFERELFTKLKAICRKQALKQFDKNTKFTKRDKELIELVPEVGSQPEYEQIGQIVFFKKYFERIIKGLIANVLREIPMNYKKFRQEQLKQKNKNYNLKILEELVKKDDNKRIHPDEQAFLLSFVNNICSILAKGFKRQYEVLSHPYINAYKTNCKPVIGIDEATDFSLIDLLAISSFGHPSISSVTLSGDVMQRMTSNGLKSWEDFISLNKKFVKKDLEVSYRQSPTLLSLAQQIYTKSTGKEATYKSYIEKDETEPKPLIFTSADEDEKLNWIAERIIEIHKAYGESIPSIAIFLPDENSLESFANKLGNIETLYDVGINVKACQKGEVLGDRDTVRVFSIDKIKGLEFEAVFFHNLDSLQEKKLTDDLLLKYLYVGLSRATFYLGLTLNDELSDNLKFLESNFDKSGKTWKI